MLKKSMVALVLAVGFIFTLGAGQSLAVYSAGGSGDLLLGQIYDVRATDSGGDSRPAQWENYFTIRNTTDRWVAFHLRFRAQTKSIEVWDHIILLSPFDVFWFDLQRAPGGGVTIFSSDTHTLLNSGIIDVGETQFEESFQTSLLEACGFTEGALAETEMGYVEAIGLWRIGNSSHDITDIATDTYDDPNDPGAVNVYDLLYDMWGGKIKGDRPAVYGRASLGELFRDCPNALQGEFEMGDVVTGAYQLENMVAFLDFRTDNTGHRDGYNPANVNNSGVIGFPVYLLIPADRCYTDTDVAWYNNPDVNTTAGPTLLDGDAWFGSGPVVPNDAVQFNAAWSLPDVERRLFTHSRWAYYMNSEVGDGSPFNADIKTDVVMTFPTKYHHYFFQDWPYWPGTYTDVSQYWDDLRDYRAGLEKKWTAIKNAPCSVTGEIWDSEQNTAGGGLSPGPSPAPWPGAVYVNHEVNVIRVGDAENILKTEYTHGQFKISEWKFIEDQRAALEVPARASALCEYPILGLTIRKHNAPNSPFVYRTSMTTMQFRTYFDHYSDFFVQAVNYQDWPVPYERLVEAVR